MDVKNDSFVSNGKSIMRTEAVNSQFLTIRTLKKINSKNIALYSKRFILAHVQLFQRILYESDTKNSMEKAFLMCGPESFAV